MSREQGITIISSLTTLWFIVSTLFPALIGGGTGCGSSTPTPPSDKEDAIEWIKKVFKVIKS